MYSGILSKLYVNNIKHPVIKIEIKLTLSSGNMCYFILRKNL